MKRSLELLLAEKLNETGEFNSIEDSINHMNNKKYSSVKCSINISETYYIVTVVHSNKVMSIWQIDYIDEEIDLISKIGFE